MISTFPRIELYTDTDGHARFRETALPLAEGTPQARLSAVFPATGYQFRESPVGFRSDYHCTTRPQWTIILAGMMEIGLRDGSSRVFHAGEGFFSNDLLPEGEIFDPARHGHWSRQIGDTPLRTLFLAVAG
ncbi:MAG: hypothetical protein LBR88_05420 [Zoogloeaceae bacterium]|jgi:hypothetical protein|nr:hypothetical protein [Zoogloeaceae bacterium]